MEQRLSDSTAPPPQSSGGLYAMFVQQQEQAAPETETYGETSIGTTACPYTNISLDSTSKLKAGIVSISYCYCTEIGTQELMWKVSAELSAASAGDLSFSSLSSTRIKLLHCLAFCLCVW